MTTITFLLRDGQEMTIDHAGHPLTLMELARRHGVPGIIGDCGGFMSCATCHVHVDSGWMDRVGAPGEEERELIAMTGDPQAQSRLGCQLWVVPELDGLRVKVAPH